MQYYKSINQTKPSKTKRALKIIAVIAGLFLIFIGAVGLIKNSDSVEHQNVSAAIEENLQLKQQLADMQMQIEELQRQNEEMSALLNTMPTPVPSEEPSPSPGSDYLY